jgi:hypothetical protein
MKERKERKSHEAMPKAMGGPRTYQCMAHDVIDYEPTYLEPAQSPQPLAVS